MSWPLVIDVAGVTRAQARARSNPHGGRPFNPKKNDTYAATLRKYAQDAMGGQPLADGAIKLIIQVRLEMGATWPEWKRTGTAAGLIRPEGRPDYDNYAKLIGDALNQVVWRDDSQIVEARITKVYAERPGLTVWIEPLPVFEKPVGRAKLPKGANGRSGI